MKYRKIGILLTGIMLSMNSIRAEDQEDPARIRLITFHEDEASPEGCFSVAEYDEQTAAEEELQRIREEGGTASFDHIIGSEEYRLTYTDDTRYEEYFFEDMKGVAVCTAENGDRYEGYGSVLCFEELYVSDLLQILSDIRGLSAQELVLPEAYLSDEDPCIRFMLERLRENGMHVIPDTGFTEAGDEEVIPQEGITEEEDDSVPEDVPEEGSSEEEVIPAEEEIQEDQEERKEDDIPGETETPEQEDTGEDIPAVTEVPVIEEPEAPAAEETEAPAAEEEQVPQETDAPLPEEEETVPSETALPETEERVNTPQITEETPVSETGEETPGPVQTAEPQEGETEPSEIPQKPALKAPALKAAAITPVKAVDTDSIQKVKPGEYEDPDYSFSFRTSAKTRIEPWTDTGYNAGKYLRNASGRSLFFMPMKDTLSGHMGVYIHDLGVYEGHTVSLKITFLWEPLKLAGKAVHPYIAVNSGAEHKGIGMWLSGFPYTARCEIFDEDTKEPVRCRFGMNFSDVDGLQFYGLKLNNGSADTIKCLYGSRVYYHRAGKVHWFYADSASASSDPLDSIRFNVNNCSSFDLTLGDRYCDFYSAFKNPLSSYTQTQSENGALAKYNYLKALFDRYGTGDVITESVTHSWVHFDAEAYGPYRMDEPQKYVIDADENGTENTLDKGESAYTYRIVYEVPIEKPEYYYDLFEVFDEMPPGIKPLSYRVRTSAGTDVSSRFTGSISGRKVTIRAADPKNASLYYECYWFDISVRLDDTIPASAFSGSGADFVNTGSVRISRLKKQENKPTNRVITHFNNQTDISVSKVFEDKRTKYYRPSSVTAILTANGTDRAQKTLTEKNKWKAVFTGLPVYDTKTGKPVTYGMKEKEVPGYRASVKKTDTYAFTITNTLYVTEISIEKQLRGNMASYDTDFKFTITCDKPCKAPYKGSREGVLDLTKGSAQLALKGKESVTVYGIPAGAKITASEEDCSAAGYTSQGRNTSFAASEDPAKNRIVFINTKEGVLPTGVHANRRSFLIPAAVTAVLLYVRRKKKTDVRER